TGVHAAAALTLTILSATVGPIWMMYACLFVIGMARAFRSATRNAFLAAVVPSDRFSNAVAWNSSANQIAAVVGPALGGLAIAVVNQTAPVFAIATALLAASTFALIWTRPRALARTTEKLSVASMLAG